MEEFKDRLRALSKARRLTAKDIAKVCGVSPKTVYDWRMGAYMPRQKTLAPLAEVLGTTTDYLIHGDMDRHRAEIIRELRSIVPRLTSSQLSAILTVAREFQQQNQ